VKPSKFGRARVIPIGDQLGRAVAETIQYVRAFYRSCEVPACDRRDEHEKRPLPRVPYLLQGRSYPSTINTNPSTINTNTIRGRLRALSLAAGARQGRRARRRTARRPAGHPGLAQGRQPPVAAGCRETGRRRPVGTGRCGRLAGALVGGE
jgi:hypothetical protein